jgi:hypothetical protein
MSSLTYTQTPNPACVPARPPACPSACLFVILYPLFAFCQHSKGAPEGAYAICDAGKYKDLGDEALEGGHSFWYCGGNRKNKWEKQVRLLLWCCCC